VKSACPFSSISKELKSTAFISTGPAPLHSSLL
jgi:hypothetical protein